MYVCLGSSIYYLIFSPSLSLSFFSCSWAAFVTITWLPVPWRATAWPSSQRPAPPAGRRFVGWDRATTPRMHRASAPNRLPCLEQQPKRADHPRPFSRVVLSTPHSQATSLMMRDTLSHPKNPPSVLRPHPRENSGFRKRKTPVNGTPNNAILWPQTNTSSVTTETGPLRNLYEHELARFQAQRACRVVTWGWTCSPTPPLWKERAPK